MTYLLVARGAMAIKSRSQRAGMGADTPTQVEPVGRRHAGAYDLELTLCGEGLDGLRFFPRAFNPAALDACPRCAEISSSRDARRAPLVWEKPTID